MKIVHWSEEDKQYLINNYGKLKTIDISKYLNRTIKSISAKAINLKLTTLKRVLIEPGIKYNRLTAIKLEYTKSAYSYWRFKCDCGKESVTRASDVAGSRIISCGCLATERYKELYGLPKNVAAQNEMYNVYKRSAIKRNYLFELTKEQCADIMSQNCHICGIEPYQIPRSNRCVNSKDFRYNGIDRYDNKLGYTLKNSKPCCGHCNKAKMDMSIQQFKSWIKRLVEFQNGKT